MRLCCRTTCARSLLDFAHCWCNSTLGVICWPIALQKYNLYTIKVCTEKSEVLVPNLIMGPRVIPRPKALSQLRVSIARSSRKSHRQILRILVAQSRSLQAMGSLGVWGRPLSQGHQLLLPDSRACWGPWTAGQLHSRALCVCRRTHGPEQSLTRSKQTRRSAKCRRLAVRCKQDASEQAQVRPGMVFHSPAPYLAGRLVYVKPQELLALV